MVATKNWISFSCIDGLNLSMRYQTNNGNIRFIKFVSKKFINSFSFPFLIESLKIIFLEIKYETITPMVKENTFVRYVLSGTPIELKTRN